MTPTERMNKVVASLEKIPPHMALVIPVRIAHRNILAAKTNEAKKRLVQAATWISIADTRKVWMGQYNRFLRPIKTPKKSNAFVELLKKVI